MSARIEDSLAADKAFAYLPVALFGSVMGLAGLSNAWHAAYIHFHTPLWVSKAIGLFALLTFIVIAFGYIIKIKTSRAVVCEEFLHPVSSSMFGTPIISLLLLPPVIANFSLPLAKLVWVGAVVLMTIFAWYTMSHWMSGRQKIAHASPAWIIPVVGMLDVPLSASSIGMQAWQAPLVFALAVGFFFVLPLFTIIFSRLMFEDPMPAAMQPSLMIISAPASVGFLAYVTTTGHIDVFAEALYMLMIFLVVVLIGKLRNLLLCSPFKVSWWSVTFPLAASAAASLRYAESKNSLLADLISITLLAGASVTIAAIAGRTLLGIVRDEMREISG